MIHVKPGDLVKWKHHDNRRYLILVPNVHLIEKGHVGGDHHARHKVMSLETGIIHNMLSFALVKIE